MIKFFILAVLLVLPACTTVSYTTTGGDQISYSNFWFEKEISDLTILRTDEGKLISFESATNKNRESEILSNLIKRIPIPIP